MPATLNKNPQLYWEKGLLQKLSIRDVAKCYEREIAELEPVGRFGGEQLPQFKSIVTPHIENVVAGLNCISCLVNELERACVELVEEGLGEWTEYPLVNVERARKIVDNLDPFVDLQRCELCEE